MTIEASSILRRAVDLLQDQTSVRWPMHELVRYLNDAQRIVVKARPDTMNTATTMTLSVGARQSLKSATANTAGSGPLSPLPSKLIEIPRNMAGDLTAVTKVERKMMDAGERGWYNTAPSISIKHFMFDERDPTAFYTYPPAASGAKLEVMYSAYPTDINEPDVGTIWSDVVGNISLPDIYGDDVLNIILAYAYSKDSEYAGNDNRAQNYRNLVTASLGADVAATLSVAPKLAMK
jgi:hypothetical protein